MVIEPKKEIFNVGLKDDEKSSYVIFWANIMKQNVKINFLLFFAEFWNFSSFVFTS